MLCSKAQIFNLQVIQNPPNYLIMVINKISLLKNTSKQIRKTTMVVGGSLLISGFMACNTGPQYELSETLDPTQGVITEVKEIEQDLFRITDETIVPLKEDSRIIAEYMDGVRDTFTLAEAQLTEADPGYHDYPRRHGMSGVLMGGMMGYMMGRSLSSPINRAAYASQSAYQKSTTSTSTMRSSATRRTVRTPKSGFGGSRSSRSYGG
jgi:hypothetical protein